MKSFLLAMSVCFATSASALVEKSVDYTHKGQTFEGFLVHKDGLTGKNPGVLVVHDWLGLTEKTKVKARQIAELGYVVFAADIYGKGVRPANQKLAGEQATRFKSDRKLFREHLSASFSQLKKNQLVDGKKTGVVGYCFGGTGAIELGRSGADVQSIVSFHGGLDSPEAALGKNIKGKVLALHGADDPFVPPAELNAFEDEMKQNKVDWQLVKFGGAVHSFTDKSAGTDNAKGAAYNEKADKRSWIILKEFLAETL